MKIKDYFYFQKSDRTIILILFAAISAAAIFISYFYKEVLPPPITSKENTSTAETAYTTRRYGTSKQYYATPGRQYYQTDGIRAERFPFDPNTADSTTLLRLGLRPWQVRNIYKYRAHGGVYRKPEDFARLYGLTAGQYRELEPYIRISSDYAPASTLVGKRQEHESYGRDTLLYPIKIKATEHIVLNTADTTMLKKVPGIGSGWARTITAYGERLGGYTSVSQLSEIDGFPEETLKYFIVLNPNPRKLNINKLTLSQLRRHPYINFYQARAICDYRRLKGTITDLTQLHLLKEFPTEAIERLRPYVEY